MKRNPPCLELVDHPSDHWGLLGFGKLFMSEKITLNVHRQAWAAEEKMRAVLRKAPCFVEGAEILHDWNPKMKHVEWLYQIPEGLEQEVKKDLESLIQELVTQHSQTETEYISLKGVQRFDC